MIQVQPEGPLSCLMAIIGQAPGGSEESEGIPFCGPSGSTLNTKLHINEIGRFQCYITNLSKTRPSTWWEHYKGIYKEQKYKKPVKKDDFSIFWDGKTPSKYLLECRDALLQELCKVKTNVFLALGADALWALTGQRSISKYRGSILTCSLPNGKVVKVVGAWHPAAIYNPLKGISPGAMAHIIQADISKAKAQSAFPELRLPKRSLIIKPTDKIVREFIIDNRGKDLAYDIETVPGGITCISLAFNRHEAISIPTTAHYWSRAKRKFGSGIYKLLEILRYVNFALTQPNVMKAAQFMDYDFVYLFRAFGIMVKKPWYDNAISHFCSYPEFPKGHDFLCSFYTDEVYYKDELKHWLKDTDDEERLWEYNARDGCTEFEVMEETNIELDSWNTPDVRNTFNFMMELMEPLLFIMLHGIKWDFKAAAEHRIYYTNKFEEEDRIIKEKYGDVNPNSPKQVKELLRRLGLEIPKYKGKETTNKKALERLAKQSPELEKIIGIRSSGKFISTYIDVGLDPVDKRYKFKMNQTRTVTGRLSSSESSFWGVGNNSENWPKYIRNMAIPDEGLVFTEADLKGAEAVVVAYLCEDPLLMELFEKGSIEPEPGFIFTNVHAFTAYLIWHQTEQKIKDEKKRLDSVGKDTITMYFRGKKTRHSANYKGTWVTLSQELKLPAKEAKALLRKFHDASPNIARWHKDVEMQLASNRTITTCLGRRRTFYDLWSPDLMRAAVAFEPQSVVVHVLNLGLINVYNELCKKYKDVALKNQVHDSLLLQHPPEMTKFIHKELHKLMSIPLTIKGRDFIIPLEIVTSSTRTRFENEWATSYGEWGSGRIINRNNWRDCEEIK